LTAPAVVASLASVRSNFQIDSEVMTEFDRWRIARQEVDLLLQQFKDGHHGCAAQGAQPAGTPPDHWLGLAHHAAAVRAAALRLLRPRTH
jgi:hypothetical protein